MKLVYLVLLFYLAALALWNVESVASNVNTDIGKYEYRFGRIEICTKDNNCSYKEVLIKCETDSGLVWISSPFQMLADGGKHHEWILMSSKK